MKQTAGILLRYGLIKKPANLRAAFDRSTVNAALSGMGPDSGRRGAAASVGEHQFKYHFAHE
ncbi:hypothetical protein [Brevibacillus massiliensis]|uniref:hypothetical protein n=1 Tax=Brevibacillus massiliensis TaxID=1118054 RepID=UPI0002F36F6D|nr:hypothetical protein [Brevibacillus massiliensis]